MSQPPATIPDPPPAARALFGQRLDLASRYAELLVTKGAQRGLIGPREAGRIWDRHLLNCLVIGERIEPAAQVVDVGSGAGLPGLVLAIGRPDLTITLLEPLARREAFLREAVEQLGLQADVVRGRAEEPAVRARLGPADIVTARAVAALDVLAGWCLPLLRPGGRLLALKGAGAEEEVQRTGTTVRRAGATAIRVVRCGQDVLPVPAIVLEITAGESAPLRAGGPRGAGRRQSSRRVITAIDQTGEPVTVHRRRLGQDEGESTQDPA